MRSPFIYKERVFDRFMVAPYFLAVVLFTASCDNNDDYIKDDIYSQEYIDGVNRVVERAKAMSDICWTPLADIPANYGTIKAGEVQEGLLYSSVKEKDKFIGYDVSMESFLSALKNPYGCLYNENLKDKTKYNSSNAASYYGVVCSSFVSYAYGFVLNYNTTDLLRKKEFSIVNSSYEEIKLCDAILYPGHVTLVTDVRIVKGVKYIEISEAQQHGVEKNWYNKTLFLGKYHRLEWQVLRNNYLHLTPEADPKIENVGEYDVLTYRGDKVSYREGEDVVVNILKRGKYDEYVLATSRDSIICELFQEEDPIVLSDLAPDTYRLYLRNGEYVSRPTHFEVIETNVRVQGISKLDVSFSSSNSVPVGVCVVSSDGGHVSAKELTDEDVRKSTVSVGEDSVSMQKLYLKVFFQGKYGRVTNDPIRIK